jgi:hypothetical protein
MISKEEEEDHRKLLHQQPAPSDKGYILSPYSKDLYDKVYNALIALIPSYWPKNETNMIKDVISKITKVWMKEAKIPYLYLLEVDIINVIKKYDIEINDPKHKPIKDSWKPPKKKRSKK